MISIVVSIIVNIWSYFINVSLYITFKLSKVYFRAVLIYFAHNILSCMLKLFLLKKSPFTYAYEHLEISEIDDVGWSHA